MNEVQKKVGEKKKKKIRWGEEEQINAFIKFRCSRRRRSHRGTEAPDSEFRFP